MKRVVTVQDISCIGKCSLTVALPILSAFGLETAVIPTAVLSTHTAFDAFTFRDLTADIPAICEQWKRQNMQFDAIYTGYLGSVEQMAHVQALIRDFSDENTLVVIDPVMGDNGKLYTGFDAQFPKHMAALCQHADVIVPNLTEATAMLDLPYAEQYDGDYVRDILRRLTALGCPKAVLTGVRLKPNTIGVVAYDRVTDTFFSYERACIAKTFHGTGDVFASTFTGALVRGESMEKALQTAVDFTVTSIQKTLDDPQGVWYGVNFEEALPLLIEKK